MTLSRAIVDIPISGGIEGKIYKALVQPGKMLAFSGARIEKVGAVSLAPRSELSEDLSGMSPVGLLSDRKSLMRILKDSDVGAFSVVESDLPSPSSEYGSSHVKSCDAAYYGGYLYFSYTINNYYYGYVYRRNMATGETTNVLAVPYGLHDVRDSMRLCVAGSYLYVTKYTQVGRYNASTGGFIDDIYVGTMTAPSICADPDPARAAQGYAYVSYLDTATGRLRIAEIFNGAASVVLTSADVGTGSPVIRPSTSQTTKFCICMPNATPGLNFYIWDRVSGVTASTSVAQYRCWCASGIEIGGVWQWVVGGEDASSYLGSVVYSFTFAGVATLSSYIIRGLVPSSQPFERDGVEYLWMRHNIHKYTGAVDTQAAEYLVRLTWSASSSKDFCYPVAKACDNEAQSSARFHAAYNTYSCSSIAYAGDSLVYLAITTPQSESSSVYSDADSARSVILRNARVKCANIEDRIVVSGGMPIDYDGRDLFESNFLLAPQILTVTGGGPGSGAILAGVTYAIAVYKDMDMHGRATFSAPSAATSWTANPMSDVTITVSQYPFGRRPFTTLVYLSSDGINYYLSGVCSLHKSGASSDAETPLVISSIITINELLYTTGGILENRQPGCITDVVAHGNRFYGVQPSGKIQYSKQVVSGVGVEWSAELLEHALLSDGGNHWRLASQDGQLIAIGEHSVQVISGEGALDTGAGSTLTTPVMTPCPGGLKPGSDIVATDAGVWYQSKSGMQLLGRSREVDGRSGAGISDLVTDITCLSAERDLLHDEALFAFDDGSVLAYSLITGAWMLRSGLGVGGEYAAIRVNGDGDLYSLDSDAEELSVCADAAPDYTGSELTIETPWLRVGAVGGDQRASWVVLLGEWLSDMRMTIQSFFDYSETAVGTFVYDFKNTVGTPRTSGQPILWRQHLGQRCSSVKLKIDVQASPGSVGGACCNLFGLSLELAQRPGLLRASTSHER